MTLRDHIADQLRAHGIEPTDQLVAACVNVCTGPIMMADGLRQQRDDARELVTVLHAALTRVAEAVHRVPRREGP